MKDYIAEKLNNMGNVEQKEELRLIIEQVFLPLYDETMEKYYALEQRVKNELPAIANSHTIYSSILPKEIANDYASWLFPVLPIQELTELNISDNKLLKGFVLDTVFIEADYLICKELSSSAEQFSGIVKIDGQEIMIRVCLKRKTDYMDSMHALYSHFINNGIPWTTLNAPYFHKMFDIVLMEEIILTKNINRVLSLEWDISFGKYGKFIRKNMIPVWNVHIVSLKSEGFPIPVIDKKLYEYKFEINETNIANGYLVDFKKISVVSTRREKEYYIVTTSERSNQEWTMYEIKKPTITETTKFSYPVVSNIQEDQFASRMINHYGTKINTKIELTRVINSLDIKSYVKFKDCEVINNQAMIGETYECNSFLIDEIRDGNISKTLLFKFSKNSNANNYLFRDIISFIVSQLQLIYPEYNCVGVLL